MKNLEKENVLVNDFEDVFEDRESKLDDLECTLSNEELENQDDIVDLSYIDKELQLEYGETKDVPDAFSQFIRSITQYKLLSAEEERELLRKYKETNDLAIKNILVCCNIRLVIHIAKKFVMNGKNDILDLIQEGTLGLGKAIDKFDLSRDIKLSTYATWWIRQAITRYIADTSNIIRLPVHMSEKLTKMKKVTKEYMDEYGVEPDDEILAEELYPESVKNRVEKVRELKSISKNIINLQFLENTVNSDDDNENTYMDTVRDLKASTEDSAVNIMLQEDVQELLGELKPREAEIIKRRFGISPYVEAETLESIGVSMGITRERVRQIENKAIKKLRNPLRARKLYGYMDSQYAN